MTEPMVHHFDGPYHVAHLLLICELRGCDMIPVEVGDDGLCDWCRRQRDVSGWTPANG